MTSLHRKANIKPENYEYIGSAYFGHSSGEVDNYGYLDEWADLVKTLAKLNDLDSEPGEIAEFVLGIETNEWSGSDEARCVTCGSALKHVRVFNHVTEGPVAVGRDCARDFWASSEEEMEVRRRLEKALIEADKKRCAEEWAEWLTWHHRCVAAFKRYGIHGDRPHYIIVDIEGSGERYGRLTAKAADLVEKIAEEEAIKEAEEALVEAIEAAAGTEPVPVTDERIKFTGTVVKEYWKSDDYGEKHVMIFLDDRGFKVWGTVPSKLWEIKIGDRLEFAATVKASDEDPGFGFFKRPTKAALLTREVL